MQFNRYAVYYTPPQGPLAEFGASWLGWDSATGKAVAHPEVSGLGFDVSELTASPRNYGFHGTLKPPFRLAPGTDATALESACANLAATLVPVTLDGLELSRLGRFLALTVKGNQAPLAQMAGAVVAGLDSFRAPASAAELARRRRANLSDRQEALLIKWGYPYVMEAFRFHITLTGRVAQAQVAPLMDRLKPQFEPLLPRPFRIEDLTLVGEDEDGRFHEVRRFRLGT